MLTQAVPADQAQSPSRDPLAPRPRRALTLTVFAIFSVTYLGEAIRWNHAVGFALIALGAGFVFKPF